MFPNLISKRSRANASKRPQSSRKLIHNVFSWLGSRNVLNVELHEDDEEDDDDDDDDGGGDDEDGETFCKIQVRNFPSPPRDAYSREKVTDKIDDVMF